MANKPTRFPNGVTDAGSPNGLMWRIGMLDPRKWHVYWTDFDSSTLLADWTTTETQAGATEALTDEDGGVLLITNSAADNDVVSMQKIGESFLMAAGKPAIFSCRFKVSSAAQCDFQAGLIVTDTTSLDATDGIYFQKDDDDAYLDVICRKNATSGSNTATAIATLTDATYVEAAWYYDGVDKVYYYINNVLIGSISGSSAYLPDTELTPTIFLQNGSANARTASIDWIFAAKMR